MIYLINTRSDGYALIDSDRRLATNLLTCGELWRFLRDALDPDVGINAGDWEFKYPLFHYSLENVDVDPDPDISEEDLGGKFVSINRMRVIFAVLDRELKSLYRDSRDYARNIAQ